MLLVHCNINFKFTFHYELIITLGELEEIKTEYKFTFHYELIITLLPIIDTQ